MGKYIKGYVMKLWWCKAPSIKEELLEKSHLPVIDTSVEGLIKKLTPEERKEFFCLWKKAHSGPKHVGDVGISFEDGFWYYYRYDYSRFGSNYRKDCIPAPPAEAIKYLVDLAKSRIRNEENRRKEEQEKREKNSRLLCEGALLEEKIKNLERYS